MLYYSNLARELAELMGLRKGPIWGILQRGGQVVIQMLENVQQATIEPFINQTVQSGSLIYTVYEPTVGRTCLVRWRTHQCRRRL